MRIKSNFLCSNCSKPLGKTGVLMPTADPKKRQMCLGCARELWIKADSTNPATGITSLIFASRKDAREFFTGKNMKIPKPKPRAKKNQITDVSKMVDKPRAEWEKRLRDFFKTNDQLQLVGRHWVEGMIKLVENLLSRREQEVREVEKKYHELIFAVGNKFGGETRHQTALRYIREAEKSICVGQEKMKIQAIEAVKI